MMIIIMIIIMMMMGKEEKQPPWTINRMMNVQLDPMMMEAGIQPVRLGRPPGPRGLNVPVPPAIRIKLCRQRKRARDLVLGLVKPRICRTRAQQRDDRAKRKLIAVLQDHLDKRAHELEAEAPPRPVLVAEAPPGPVLVAEAPPRPVLIQMLPVLPSPFNNDCNHSKTDVFHATGIFER
jgi:hypothetical protein